MLEVNQRYVCLRFSTRILESFVSNFYLLFILFFASPSILSLNFREFQFAQAMLFAIEEINNNTELLPGISLGYKIYDTCGSISRSIKVALTLNSVNKNMSLTSKGRCSTAAQIQAVMGETSSSPSTAVATVFGAFHIPLVSVTTKMYCISLVCFKHDKYGILKY